MSFTEQVGRVMGSYKLGCRYGDNGLLNVTERGGHMPSLAGNLL